MPDMLPLEAIEAIENALNVLEDAEEYEKENIQSHWRERYWDKLGEGGTAIEGLKLVLRRLKERYY